jgi:hypothetical protein
MMLVDNGPLEHGPDRLRVIDASVMPERSAAKIGRVEKASQADGYAGLPGMLQAGCSSA